MPEEQVITLGVPPASLPALLEHPLFAGARPASRRTRAVWFDTAERELLRRGIVLCVIGSGNRRVAHGAAPDAHPRSAAWHGAFDFSGMDKRALRTRLERARRAGLAPVIEAAAIVRRWPLRLADGATVTAELAEGELSAGDSAVPLCVLRLRRGAADTGCPFAAAQRLCTDLPLEIEPATVPDRAIAIALERDRRSVKSRPSALRETDTLAQALRGIVDACVAQFRLNERAGLEAEDPEYVHQMRVAIRRLRSAVRAFAPVLAPDFADRFLPGLRALAGALGPARDWDVLHDELVLPVVRAHPEDARLSALAAEVARRREAARAGCRTALREGAHRLLLVDLLAHVHCEWPDAAAEPAAPLPDLGEFAVARLDALFRRVLKAARRAHADDIPALHRLRIMIKRLRYAIEFFAPLFPAKSQRRFLARMAQLQEDLGLLNDLANARPKLAQCAQETPAVAEGVAYAEGWYAPKLAEMLERLPAEVRTLSRLRPYWRR